MLRNQSSDDLDRIKSEISILKEVQLNLTHKNIKLKSTNTHLKMKYENV